MGSTGRTWSPGRRWIWPTIAVAIMAGWCALRSPSIAVYRAERRDIRQTVIASGRVRPLSRVRLGAAVVGTVTDVRVREGVHVKEGQVLVVLDDAEARGAVLQAQAAVTDAEAQVEETKQILRAIATAELQRAEATLARAETDYRRVKDLHGDGIVSDDQLGLARQALAVARSEHQVATLQVSRVKNDGTSQKRAEAALMQARGQLERASASLEHTRVRAPGNGTIITRDVEPGDTVQVGRVLMEMTLDAETQVTAEPDERNLALLRPGQRARASSDAFPERSFAARVVYVSPAVDAQRGTIEVRLAVDDPPDYLRPDMTVSVEIEVARREKVMAIPANALRDPTTVEPWVMAIAEGRAARRGVELGARDEQWAEIKAGLHEGDPVIPATTRGITIGQRVRPGRPAAPPGSQP